MKFTDTHCHLDFKELSQDLPQLLFQCQKLGVHRIIVPSIAPSNWQNVLSLTQRHNTIHLLAALGIHPWFLTDLREKSLDDLAQLVAQHQTKLCALGEMGIDLPISEKYDNLTKQLTFFEYQLVLAKHYNLPVLIHHRRSHSLIITLLKKHQLTTAGIIHGFSGSYQEAIQYLDLGFKLGVGGTITYARAQKTIKTIKRVPLSSLVLETDAPAMPLYGFQGKHNTPLQLLKVFEQLVAIRNESAEEIAQQIEINSQQVFNLNKPDVMV